MSEVVRFTESGIKELLLRESAYYAFSVASFPSPESLQAYQRSRGILDTLTSLFGKDVIDGIRSRTTPSQFTSGVAALSPEAILDNLNVDRISHASSVADVVERLKSAAGDVKQVLGLRR
jgi:hypothetical protein